MAAQTPEERKHELRQSIREARKAMPRSERDRRNKQLCNQVDRYLTKYPARSIAAYVPMDTEPGGRQLLDVLSRHCERFYLPCSLPDRSLAWGLYTGEKDLAPGAYNIPEPQGDRFTGEILASIDLVLAPALAVDRNGFRLGKGAGYYDRALSQYSGRTITLVYSTEVLDSIPTEPHDIPTDTVLSD